VDQGLSWDEVAGVLAEGGAPARPDALMKRFERLKDRLGKMARDRGLVD
jgi:RNA polymerase sigma-70 factor (ECF subfamily)